MPILVTLMIIIAIPLILALFVGKNYSVEREIIITKPKQLVFEYLKHLKNQDNFSKWATMDPNMKKKFRGIDGTEGFISAWESDNRNVGKGEQEIKKITNGFRIDFELRFIKPFAGKADAYMTTEFKTNNETIVVWGFDSKMKYPMNLMLLFMDMEKMIGNDLATGLSNLKNILEK